MHDARCALSTIQECVCECGGKLHGSGYFDGQYGQNEIEMTIEMGGELAEFLKKNQSRQYYCYGLHRGKREQAHGADKWYGYEAENGLADASGKKWWVFTVCPDPRRKGSGYQTSFQHFESAKHRANLMD